MGNVFYVRFSFMNDTFLALQLLHNRVLVDRLFFSHTHTEFDAHSIPMGRFSFGAICGLPHCELGDQMSLVLCG